MDLGPSSMSRRTALGLMGLTGTVVVSGPQASAAAALPAPVQLVDDGPTVTLSNGVVSATVDKSNGRTTDLRLTSSVHGNEAFNVLSGRMGGGYTEFDYVIADTTYRKGMTAASYRLVSQSDARVEISVELNDPTNLPFAVEVHVVLERGASGLYYFLVFHYPQTMPDKLTIGQLRYAFSLGDPSFTYFVVDDRRGVQQRPTIAQTQAWTTVQDTTYLLPDGTLYSKYQNISDLEGDSHVFMASNGRLGVSLVQANKEAFNGGPTKQELTVHDYYDGEILLWHPITSHYGSPSMVPDKGWEKIYGPFFLSVEEAAPSVDPVADVRGLWERAKRLAEREQRKWPYAWVTDPTYALASRSTVSGRLTIKGHSARNAWIVLSPNADWQYESKGYVPYVRTDSRGRFTLHGVRAGTYTVSAFVDGVYGEYSQSGVNVPAGRHHDLGCLRWSPLNHGRTLWQIGVPDRSTKEFHIFGGPDGHRSHMNWLEYPYEFPEGVDFRVGVDDYHEKWNYYQPAFRTPGTDLQLALRGTLPDRTLTSWRIRFDSAGYRRGVATLDIALASSVFGTLRVALNAVELSTMDPLPGPPGDNASYRLAARAMYRQLPPISFPADAIVRGENVITLAPARPPKAPLTPAGKVDDWMEPMAGIMYDVIRLQVDERR